MAEAKFTVKWATDIRELRKGFAEFDKFEKRHYKSRDTFRKKEAAHHKEDLKRNKDLFGYREKQLKKEETLYKRQYAIQQRMFREQDTSVKKVSRAVDHERRKQETHDKRKGGGRGTMRSLVSGAGGFLAGGIAGLLMGAAFRGYENYVGVQKQLSGGVGRGTGNLLRNAQGAGRGGNLGYNVEERAGMEPLMARQTGVGGAKGIRSLMAGSRASGMDAGEVGDIFGALREGGTQFSGTGTTMGPGGKEKMTVFSGRGKQEFKNILSAGMASGLEKGRLPEFAQGVATFVRQQSQMSGGTVTGGGFAQLAAALGKNGGAALQGNRGMAALQRFDSALKGPGGGEEGAGFVQRAMGFGQAGSGVGYFGAERQREKGLEDPENFNKIMKQAKLETGGDKDEMSNYLRESGFASSMSMGDKLQDVFNKGGSSKDQQDAVAKIQKESLSLEEQAQKSMTEANTKLGEIAKKFDKSVGIGERSADAMEAAEKLQQQLVELVFDSLAFWKDLFNSARKTTMGKALFGDAEAPEKRLQDARKEQAAALGGSPTERSRRLAAANFKSANASMDMGDENGYAGNRAATLRGKYLSQVAPNRKASPAELSASMKVARGAAGGESEYRSKDYADKYIKLMAQQKPEDIAGGKFSQKLLDAMDKLVRETKANRPHRDVGATYHPGPTARADATGR